MKKTTKKPEIIEGGRIAKNVAGASSITGIPIVVIQAAKDKGCRAFKANGNIDCEELTDFVAENADTSNADHVIDPRVQKAWQMFESRMSTRQKRLIAGKKLIPIEAVRTDWTRNVVACKMKFYNAENTISVEAGMKLGLRQDQITTLKEIITKHHRPAIKEMHKGEYGQCSCPHCGKEITE